MVPLLKEVVGKTVALPSVVSEGNVSGGSVTLPDVVMTTFVALLGVVWGVLLPGVG